MLVTTESFDTAPDQRLLSQPRSVICIPQRTEKRVPQFSDREDDSAFVSQFSGHHFYFSQNVTTVKLNSAVIAGIFSTDWHLTGYGFIPDHMSGDW